MTLRLLLSSVICFCILKSANAESSSRLYKSSVSSHNGLFGVSSIAGVSSKNGKTSSVSGVKFYPGPYTMKPNDHLYAITEETDNTFPAHRFQSYSNSRNDPDAKWLSGADYFQNPTDSLAIMAKDGRFATGRVQIFPNSRVVSATAVAGYGPQAKWSNGAQFYQNMADPFAVAVEKDGRFATGKVQIFPHSKGVSASAAAGYDPGFKWANEVDYFQNPPDFITKNMDPWFPKNNFNNFPPRKYNTPNNNWFYNSFDPFMNLWR